MDNTPPLREVKLGAGKRFAGHDVFGLPGRPGVGKVSVNTGGRDGQTYRRASEYTELDRDHRRVEVGSVGAWRSPAESARNVPAYLLRREFAAFSDIFAKAGFTVGTKALPSQGREPNRRLATGS